MFVVKYAITTYNFDKNPHSCVINNNCFIHMIIIFLNRKFFISVFALVSNKSFGAWRQGWPIGNGKNTNWLGVDWLSLYLRLVVVRYFLKLMNVFIASLVHADECFGEVFDVFLKCYGRNNISCFT